MGNYGSEGVLVAKKDGQQFASTELRRQNNGKRINKLKLINEIFI